MNRSVLALLVATAGIASAQQVQQIDPQVMTGHPISRLPRPNPPTLPLRNPVKPNPWQRDTKQPTPPPRTMFVPVPVPYYPYYPQQPQQSNVSVNVTNVIETPPPVTMIAPMMVSPGYANQRVWDAQADIAEENAARERREESDGKRAEAEAADVKSPEAIVGALYDVLSGPRGTTRNWDRFKSLFADGARLIATRTDGSGPARPMVMSVDEYASVAGPALEVGVYQREVKRSIEQFGAIAHVFSTYECRRTTSDEKPFQRGINSIQLLNDGTRWWIMSVSWDAERPGMPIPAKYLAPLPAAKR
jgi:hypothetical protein